MECPIMCGKCCYDPAYGRYEPVCHYWSRNGCRLSRDKRPDFCNEYLCEKALKLRDSNSGEGDG
jgi:hypothetical protein